MQWSAEAAPSSQASPTPPVGPSWLACTRSPMPSGRRRGQHGTRLFDVEGPRLAEGVAPAGRRRRRGDHGFGEQPEVAVTIAGELGRHQVGAEEGGFGREGPGDAEMQGFVDGGEPVAGLDLDGGGARGQGLADQAAGVGLEVVRAAPPGWPPRCRGCRPAGTAGRPCAGRTPRPGHRRRSGGCGSPRSRASRTDRRGRPGRRCRPARPAPAPA